MTRDFKIENVSPGDILIAHDTWHTRDGIAPLAHQWLVLGNHCEDEYMGRYVEVYIMYSQLPHEERFSFYHATFKSGAYQKLDWSLKSGT